MKNHKARATVHVIVGCYLIYLAYELFQGLDKMTENKWLFVLFMIVFAAAGAVLAVYGGRNYYHLWKNPEEVDEMESEDSEEDEK